MAYFIHTENSRCYSHEWESLLSYIKTKWPQDCAAHLGDLEHHIEAKALYVFTMSRHLIDGAEILSRNRGWQPVFVEASMLLFPMIELVGQARLGREQGQGRPLGSGIDWLTDPLEFPSGMSDENMKGSDKRVSTLGNYMTTLREGPKVKELFHMRNYFLHGLKNQRDPNFDIGAVQTSMNCELPYAIVEQSKVGLATYWKQLKTTDDSIGRNWVTRLAEADIYPFGIMGSPIYEKGLVDSNIVYWLTP